MAKTKSKGGRPRKITPVVVSKLERALQNGFTIRKACDLSGISHETYYNELEISQEFADKMDKAEHWAEEKARQNIVNAIAKGDDRNSRWYLERKARAEFATRQEITGKDGKPFVEALSEEEKARLDDIFKVKHERETKPKAQTAEESAAIENQSKPEQPNQSIDQPGGGSESESVSEGVL